MSPTRHPGIVGREAPRLPLANLRLFWAVVAGEVPEREVDAAIEAFIRACRVEGDERPRRATDDELVPQFD